MLHVTCYVLNVTCYILHFTCYMLRVTCYMLCVTCYMLQVKCYILHVTCYMLRVKCYILHFTFYTLHVTYYMLHVAIQSKDCPIKLICVFLLLSFVQLETLVLFWASLSRLLASAASNLAPDPLSQMSSSAPEPFLHPKISFFGNFAPLFLSSKSFHPNHSCS